MRLRRSRATLLLLLTLLTFSFVPLSVAAQATPGAAATPNAIAPPAPANPRLPVTVADRDGRQVTVTDVSRIVPLNGDIAEIVWTLGLGANIVGVDVSATYPPSLLETLPQIGYQRSLSAEGVLSLNPTVIIGSQNAGPPDVLEQIRSAGVPTVIVDDPATSVDGVVPKIRAVAEALGVAAEGEALAAKTQTEIDAARALVAGVTERPRAAFLYVRGAGTQMIAGSETSADAMITAAGGINAGAEAGLVGYQPLTAESLVAAQPDVLLLLSAGLESVGGVDGLLQIPGIAATPAGQNRNVLDYDDLYLLAMGPRTGQALRDLALGFHPDLAAATPGAA